MGPVGGKKGPLQSQSEPVAGLQDIRDRREEGQKVSPLKQHTNEGGREGGSEGVREGVSE